MKKIIFLFLIAIAFTNCTANEIDTPLSDGILGDWQGQSIEFTGTANSDLYGIPVNVANLIGEGYDIAFTFSLTENPNLATTKGDYSMEVTISTITGENITENQENIDFTSEGSWNKSDDTIALTIDDQEVIANITELTETELILEFSQEITDEFNGTAVTVNINYKIVFIR